MNERRDSMDHGTPAELRNVERALERAGARERGAAPEGLEGRIAARTAPIISGRDGGRGVIARIGGGGAWRVAAAVAVLATAGVLAVLAVWPSGPAGGGAAPLASAPGPEAELDRIEEDLDAILGAAETPDETLAALDRELDELFGAVDEPVFYDSWVDQREVLQ